MASTRPFGALISYRHIEPDRRVAAWLQAALETYRVPKALVAAGAQPRVGRVRENGVRSCKHTSRKACLAPAPNLALECKT
jgi:hypothetical protein